MAVDDKERIFLPPRPFLYTLDQIATLVHMDLPNLKYKMVYYEGRSTGTPHVDQLLCSSIAMPGDRPDWRVAEKELKRWLRRKGFRF